MQAQKLPRQLLTQNKLCIQIHDLLLIIILTFVLVNWTAIFLVIKLSGSQDLPAKTVQPIQIKQAHTNLLQKLCASFIAAALCHIKWSSPHSVPKLNRHTPGKKEPRIKAINEKQENLDYFNFVRLYAYNIFIPFIYLLQILSLLLFIMLWLKINFGVNHNRKGKCRSIDYKYHTMKAVYNIFQVNIGVARW